MSVLQTDQRRLNCMRLFGADCRLNLLGRNAAPNSWNPMELDASQCPGGALLISNNMRRAFDDHFLSRLRMEANGELIAHCAGWHEERGLFSKHRGNHILQPI